MGYVNNKKLGTAFEHKVCNMLSDLGYWVHFIVPDARGAQPFDIIAVKDGRPYAIDCKTCAAKVFDIGRLENNQIFAFEKWMRCGNGIPVVVVEHDNHVYCIEYPVLKAFGKCRIGGQKGEKTHCSNGDNIIFDFDDFFGITPRR